MIKVKKGYYLKLLTPEKMKLLGSTKSLVYIFFNKLFSQLLDIPSKTFTFLKALDSEFFVY